jgi:hypothetical protein
MHKRKEGLVRVALLPHPQAVTQPPQPMGCEVIAKGDCLTLRPQMLLAVPVSTAHIQNLLEAVRVHHFQPVSLLLSESPGLTAKQQHRQHIGTETLHFELDTHTPAWQV